MQGCRRRYGGRQEEAGWGATLYGSLDLFLSLLALTWLLFDLRFARTVTLF